MFKGLGGEVDSVGILFAVVWGRFPVGKNRPRTAVNKMKEENNGRHRPERD